MLASSGTLRAAATTNPLALLNYRICSRNLRPRVFCAPQFLKEDFGFIFAPRISRTIVLFIYQ